MSFPEIILLSIGMIYTPSIFQYSFITFSSSPICSSKSAIIKIQLLSLKTLEKQKVFIIEIFEEFR